MASRIFRLILLTILVTGVAWSKDIWIQVSTPHFTVYSNGGEKQARRIAREFEQMRLVFEKGASKLRLDSGSPIYVIAARDEGTMKQLLPEMWAKRGRAKPAGAFDKLWEKSFAIVRLDATSEDSYQVVYHEYIHYLLSLNFRRLPVWLDEGMAEFYGNALLRENEVRVALPSRMLGYLRPTTWIPLQKIISVTPDSPYYTEEGRAGPFYAEAWLLTHYLILGKNMNGGALLNEFGKLLQDGMDEGEAFRKIFGDPKKMDDDVSNYARQPAFTYLGTKTDLTIKEDQFPVTKLSDGEWAAFLAGFDLSQRRLERARALLEQALKENASSAVANENMGFAAFHQGKDAEAAQYFAKALAANPKAYLSAYYHSMLTSKGDSETEVRKLDAKLSQVLELNPQFAPAYVTLSLVKVRLGNLQQARGLAAKAAQLEPTRAGYLLNFARIQHRLGESADAKWIAGIVAKRWRGPDRDEALDLLASLPDSSAAIESAGAASVSASPGPEEKFVRGTVTTVACTPTSREVTLKADGQTMKLKFGKPMMLGWSDTIWYGSDHFDPCHHLEGSPAVVRYKPAGGEITGEMTWFAIRDTFPESITPAAAQPAAH